MDHPKLSSERVRWPKGDHHAGKLHRYHATNRAQRLYHRGYRPADDDLPTASPIREESERAGVRQYPSVSNRVSQPHRLGLLGVYPHPDRGIHLGSESKRRDGVKHWYRVGAEDGVYPVSHGEFHLRG